MVRLIVRRITRNSGYVKVDIETHDVDCPEMEKLLTRGGYGGGPDNENFDYSEMIGAEVRKP